MSKLQSGPEARLTGRPEVCPTFGAEQLPLNKNKHNNKHN